MLAKVRIKKYMYIYRKERNRKNKHYLECVIKLLMFSV